MYSFYVSCSGEALRIVTDRLDQKNIYAFNPALPPNLQ